nr:hypothetical protein [Tanacetum cinerariifolium]
GHSPASRISVRQGLRARAGPARAVARLARAGWLAHHGSTQTDASPLLAAGLNQ